MKIESDVNKIWKHNERVQNASINRENFGIQIDSKKPKLFVRFCKEDEVVSKNQIFLVFKGAFLAKMKQIDQNGQSIQIQHDIYNWVDENYERIYNEHIGKSNNNGADQHHLARSNS